MYIICIIYMSYLIPKILILNKKYIYLNYRGLKIVKFVNKIKIKKKKKKYMLLFTYKFNNKSNYSNIRMPNIFKLNVTILSVS